MKALIFSFLLLSTFLLFSCKKENIKLNPFLLGIDVQSSFNQDKVKILIDGKVMIHDVLQTESSTGVCPDGGRITTPQNEGEHEIKVILNNTDPVSTVFTLNNNLYIGINYNPQTEAVSFIYSETVFLYD